MPVVVIGIVGYGYIWWKVIIKKYLHACEYAFVHIKVQEKNVKFSKSTLNIWGIKKKKKSGELKLCLVGEISRRRKNSFCIVMNWGGCSFWNYLFERRIDHKQLISKIVKDLQMKIEKNQKEKALRFSRHRNILASSAPLKCWENINI